jgi:hypothetical protein
MERVKKSGHNESSDSNHPENKGSPEQLTATICIMIIVCRVLLSKQKTNQKLIEKAIA